jgi:hypothetical protein
MSEKQRAEMPKSPGRPKGVPNKTTATLKEAIILAAERVGNDGKGKRGLAGYLEHVASTDIKAFSSLLGKVIPLQVTGPDGADGLPGAIQITIVDPR